MKDVHTEIEIEASSERVWQVLTDFAAFPEWNPFVRSLEGELEAGSRLKVRLQGVTFKPTVLKVEPNRELRWRGRILMPGIFDGEHFFIIESLGEGKTRFVQGERFTGLLVLVAKNLDRNTQQGFEDMNRALKARAEEANQPEPGLAKAGPTHSGTGGKAPRHESSEEPGEEPGQEGRGAV